MAARVLPPSDATLPTASVMSIRTGPDCTIRLAIKETPATRGVWLAEPDDIWFAAVVATPAPTAMLSASAAALPCPTDMAEAEADRARSS